MQGPPGNPCSAFTRVAACTLARPPIRGPLYRRLQPFRRLHDCSGCFRLERVAGWVSHPLETAAFHGAHPLLTFPEVAWAGARISIEDRIIRISVPVIMAETAPNGGVERRVATILALLALLSIICFGNRQLLKILGALSAPAWRPLWGVAGC